MDQHSRGAITSLKQHTVGGAAPLQGVFQFEAVPLGAQTAETNDPIVDRQLDRATRGWGAGHAHLRSQLNVGALLMGAEGLWRRALLFSPPQLITTLSALAYLRCGNPGCPTKALWHLLRDLEA